MNDLKRKQHYVDTSVQGGLIRRVFLHWITFLIVTGMAILILKTLLGDPALSFSQRFRMEARDFATIGIIFVAIFPAFMLDTIRFSNRFVGPIVRLRRHLVELGQDGETSEVGFRDNDFWQEVATEFNRVNELFQAQKSEIEALKSQLGQRQPTSASPFAGSRDESV